MATNQADGAVALIDLRTRRVVGRLPSKHGAAANALAFLADGRRLATGDAMGRVAIWDVGTRHILRAARFRGPVWWVAVSADNKLLAAQTQAEGTPGSSVEVRELASGRTLYSKAVPYGPGGLSFGADGELLATLGCCEQGSRIEVWDSRSGTSRYRPRLPGIARSIAFSPDGRYLGAGTAGGRVVLWDADDGHRMGASFQAAAGAVNPISFSPDGRLLAVSGEDGTATIWDLESRKRLGESFPIPQAVIPVARFAGNGDLVIANLADAAVWPTDPARWERFACQATGRDMTREEWNDALPDRPYQHVCPPGRARNIARGHPGVLLSSVTPAQAAFPGRNGRIAFLDSDGGLSSVWPNGVGRQRLVRHGGLRRLRQRPLLPRRRAGTSQPGRFGLRLAFACAFIRCSPWD
jgi:sugar lactone lactonase YvrE